MARYQQLQTIFTELITAYGRKDFDTFETHLLPDTHFEWPFLPLPDFPRSMVGSSAFVAASKEGMADCTPYGHVVDQFYEMKNPDWLLVEYHTDAVHLPTGRCYANTYLGILRFEGDKVAYWKEYVNPLPILEVYGADFVNQAAKGAGQ